MTCIGWRYGIAQDICMYMYRYWETNVSYGNLGNVQHFSSYMSRSCCPSLVTDVVFLTLYVHGRKQQLISFLIVVVGSVREYSRITTHAFDNYSNTTAGRRHLRRWKEA